MVSIALNKGKYERRRWRKRKDNAYFSMRGQIQKLPAEFTVKALLMVGAM